MTEKTIQQRKGGKALSRQDRAALLRLNQSRRKLARAMVSERSAKLRSDFEAQIAAIYQPHDSEAWEKAQQMAKTAVAEANQLIQQECDRLGILKRFAPEIDVHWYNRGENAAAARRKELHKVAESMIAQLERNAVTVIERTVLEVETELLAGTLSRAGRQFLEQQLPSVEELMPTLDMAQMENLLPSSRYGQ
jgi:hypothetical protein